MTRCPHCGNLFDPVVVEPPAPLADLYQRDPALLMTKVEDFLGQSKFRVRVLRVLSEHETFNYREREYYPDPIVTLGQLITQTERDLVRKPDLGPISVNWIKMELQRVNLRLGMGELK